MPGRKYSPSPGSGPYRYGFNGKENDNDVKGEGNQQDYGMRICDPRLGKFLSVDPLSKNYSFYSPYHFAGNSPIKNIDLDGGEPKDKKGEYDYGKMSIKSTGQDIGDKILLDDPVLGMVTVEMVKDKTTKQVWFITQKPNTNEMYYYHADDGNHQFFHMKKDKTSLTGRTPTDGNFMQYDTPEQEDAKRRADIGNSIADGIGYSVFFGGVGGSAAPAMVYGAPYIAQAGRFLGNGIANEASLLKHIPQSYLRYGKIFSANLGIQFAFNGRDADVYSAAANTVNPILSYLTTPFVKYRPFSGDKVPTIEISSPEGLVKRYLMHSGTFLLGQFAPPNPTTDYLINTYDEAVDKYINSSSKPSETKKN